MLPIPAIDIQSGKCVRLQKGDLSSTKIYFEKPVDAAAHWIKEGTNKLHLVDLDGAKSGKPENLEYVLEIKEKFPDVNLQLGGGVRDLETLDLLQEVISEYQGTVLLISHDRDFLNRTVETSIILTGQGEFLKIVGSWANYQSLKIKNTARKKEKISKKKSVETSKSQSFSRSEYSFVDQHRLKQLPILIERILYEIKN